MPPIEPSRWDDYVLAALLLVISVPRFVLALAHDHPLGVEGTLSMLCTVLGLAILLRRAR